MKLSDISELNKEDILAALGLSTKPTVTERVMSSAGLFGLGALVGAGVALLLAPSSGQDLRDDLGKRIRRYTPEVEEALSDARDGRVRDNETRSAT
ncbi:MAG TPA: YtxH domain-containing protein [Polyangia bacterium]